MYYVLLRDLGTRTAVIDALKRAGILAVFHYVPLHRSPAGRRLGTCRGDMAVTEAVADRVLRLPLWIGLEAHQATVIGALSDALC